MPKVWVSAARVELADHGVIAVSHQQPAGKGGDETAQGAAVGVGQSQDQDGPQRPASVGIGWTDLNGAGVLVPLPIEEGIQHSQCIAQYRGSCGTAHTQVEDHKEDGVQDEVGDGGDPVGHTQAL